MSLYYKPDTLKIVFQTYNDIPTSQQTISVGTQTDAYYVKCRKLTRTEALVSFSENGVKSKHISKPSESSDTDSEQGCNMEVFQTLKDCQEAQNYQDNVIIKRQLEVNSNTLR